MKTKTILLTLAVLLACGDSNSPGYKCNDGTEMVKTIEECTVASGGSDQARRYCNCSWDYVARRYACDANPTADDLVAACRYCAAQVAGVTCPF